MPVGRLYQPPQQQHELHQQQQQRRLQKKISEIKSPFLDGDNVNRTPVRRNFVIKKKVCENGSTTSSNRGKLYDGQSEVLNGQLLTGLRDEGMEMDQQSLRVAGVTANGSVEEDKKPFANGVTTAVKARQDPDQDSGQVCVDESPQMMSLVNGDDTSNGHLGEKVTLGRADISGYQETATTNGGDRGSQEDVCEISASLSLQANMCPDEMPDPIHVDTNHDPCGDEVLNGNDDDLPQDGGGGGGGEEEEDAAAATERDQDHFGNGAVQEGHDSQLPVTIVISNGVEDVKHEKEGPFSDDDDHHDVDEEEEEEEKEEEIKEPLVDSTSCRIPSNLPSRAKGLKNLGNTCFMNSIVQCLAHTPRILEFCLQDHHHQQVGKITSAFINLIKDMWSDDLSSGPGDPGRFKREMGAFASKFLGFEQHDSQEFLQYALEGIHGELNRKKKDGEDDNKNQTHQVPNHDHDDPEAPGLVPSESGRRCWRRYLRREGDSLVTDLFLGQFRSTLKCTVCDYESVTFEPFWVVSLPIPRKRMEEVRLTDCMDLFVKEETLDGDEKPTCDRCKTRTRCTKWYAVERWPDILVVHLKRFSPGERFRAKLSCHVDVPVTDLNLSPYSKSGPAFYDLYGVSNHSGTLYGGHYTAYCRNPNSSGGRWALYNDRAVSGTSATGVISYEAYLLFFERTKIRSSPDSEEDSASTLSSNSSSEKASLAEDGEDEW